MLVAVLHPDKNAEVSNHTLHMSGTPEQPRMSLRRLGKLGPARRFVRSVEVPAVLSHTGFAKVSIPLHAAYARPHCIADKYFQDILPWML